MDLNSDSCVGGTQSKCVENEKLSVERDELYKLVKRFGNISRSKSDLSDEKMLGKISRHLEIKGMQFFYPSNEKDLEDYVDALADVYRAEHITDSAVKSYFLSHFRLAKETAAKLPEFDDVDAMFDKLAVLQFPHHYYCQQVSIQ